MSMSASFLVRTPGVARRCCWGGQARPRPTRVSRRVQCCCKFPGLRSAASGAPIGSMRVCARFHEASASLRAVAGVPATTWLFTATTLYAALLFLMVRTVVCVATGLVSEA